MSSSDANHQSSLSSSSRRHQRQMARRASSEDNRHQNIVLPAAQDSSAIRDVAASSSDEPPPPPLCRRSEIEAEDDLFDQIEQMINRFLIRPGRRLPYNNVVRWTVNLGPMPDYSVVLIIRQPASLI